MRKVFLLAACVAIAITACKKESNKEYCWVKFDNRGNDLEIICDKSENEMKELAGSSCNCFPCNSGNNFGNSQCRFYYKKQ